MSKVQLYMYKQAIYLDLSSEKSKSGENRQWVEISRNFKKAYVEKGLGIMSWVTIKSWWEA